MCYNNLRKGQLGYNNNNDGENDETTSDGDIQVDDSNCIVIPNYSVLWHSLE
jgi:hypothetical protein